jgi:hypothetical protein
MDRINMTAAEIFRDELQARTRTLPLFLRPQLGAILGMLDMWVASVEARLAALQKMPSAAVLNALIADVTDAGLVLAPLDTETDEVRRHRELEEKRLEQMHARLECNSGECDQ